MLQVRCGACGTVRVVVGAGFGDSGLGVSIRCHVGVGVVLCGRVCVLGTDVDGVSVVVDLVFGVGDELAISGRVKVVGRCAGRFMVGVVCVEGAGVRSIV